MVWTLRLALGIGAAIAGGAALACPNPYFCEPPPPRYETYGAYDRQYDMRREWEARWRHEGPPPCLRACAAPVGEVSLPSSFFAGGGGVGPIPVDSFFGGGVFIISDGAAFARAGARASAHASAFAHAQAHVHASTVVRFRGGGFKGGKKGH